MVFNTGEIYHSNNADKETNFQDEVDNQSSVSDVRNFMIGPVYGANDSKVPNGIVQFINKIDTDENNDS